MNQINYQQELDKLNKFYENEHYHADKISYYLQRKIETIQLELQRGRKASHHSRNSSSGEYEDKIIENNNNQKQKILKKKQTYDYFDNALTLSNKNSMRSVSFKDDQEEA